MADLSSVTDNYFTIASESFADNLSSSILAGATTVPVNSAVEYATGDTVCLTVEPGTVNEATFIGKKDSGNQFIECVWTEGNVGVGHDAGATIVDYDSATHHSAQSKGMKQEHNDDGTHSDVNATSVTSALLTSTGDIEHRSVSLETINDERHPDFIASGGVIAQTVGLTGSFSDIVYTINGRRYSVTGVANKAYTASKDTYVDIGTNGTVDYNEVVLGATAPTLAADHIRIAKVITDGTDITSVKQDGDNDLIGNMIYPRANQKFTTAYKSYLITAATRTSSSWATFSPASLPSGHLTITTRTGQIKVDLSVWASVSTGNAELGVYINGTNYELWTGSGNTTQYRTGTLIVRVPPGTYTALFRFKSSGGGTITIASYSDHYMGLTEV